LELGDETRAVAREFFDLPLAEKIRVGQPSRDVARGYTPIESEAVARLRGAATTAGDLMRAS
jgi:isopenicillin N synthase-like dioxygenase